MKQSHLVNGAILIVLIIISYLGYTEKALWVLALVIGGFAFWVMILLGMQNDLEEEGARLSEATKSLLEENERLTEENAEYADSLRVDSIGMSTHDKECA